MKIFSRLLFIVFTLCVVSACQNTDKFKVQDQNFQISAVEVDIHDDPKVTQKILQPTESFPGVLSNTIRNYAAEYNATRPNATVGYKLKVDITKVHFKNAVVSLLVGDNNRILGNATLIDGKTGAVVHTVPANYIDGASGVLNGVTGAVLSIVVKKEAAEGTMAKGVSKNIMKLLYPETELSNGSQQRLKDKSVFQPRTSAISTFSVPAATKETSNSSAEPAVVVN